VGLLLAAITVLPVMGADGTLPDRLTETVEARMAKNGVAGAVVVLIEGGAPVWTGALGMADPATGRAMRADTLFRVESISKPVTAWGAMRLAETGRIDLDAPIGPCLARWSPPEAMHKITPRMLLGHTAGIGLGDFAARYPPDGPRPDLPTHIAQDFTLIAAPRSGFSYSDTGYNLMELVVEDCTGEDFAALMAREVLAPLGMTGASFDWTGAEMPVGHDLRGRPVAPYVYPGRASGGLHATAADIARFAVAGMAGAEQPVLSPDGVAALHRPQVTVGGLFGMAAQGYGLGHFTEVLSDGRAAVWLGGQGHGWMSHMHIVPETGDGIVILSNSQRAWPLFAALLRDWSESLRVAPVGMTRVLWAERMARLGIALGLLVGAFGIWMASRPGRRARFARISAAGIAAAMILWPRWAAAQDYLFLFSILPGLWPWLGAASVLAGLGLAAMALAPGNRAGRSRQRRPFRRRARAARPRRSRRQPDRQAASRRHAAPTAPARRSQLRRIGRAKAGAVRRWHQASAYARSPAGQSRHGQPDSAPVRRGWRYSPPPPAADAGPASPGHRSSRRDQAARPTRPVPPIPRPHRAAMAAPRLPDARTRRPPARAKALRRLSATTRPEPPLRNPRQREEKGAGPRSLKQHPEDAAGGPKAEPGKERQGKGNLRQQDQGCHGEALPAR
jgi:CubicO group peptidase (beta-lactamase class C family)